jgi:hypothetical protein
MVNVDVLARGGKGMSRRPFINAPLSRQHAVVISKTLLLFVP